MPCDPGELKHVPLFALLDQEEIAVLAAQVELKTFAARQRIYKMGDPGMHAYILMSGSVQVSTVDEDHQEVVVDQPGHGQFFGFASMLEQTPHQTSALAMEKSVCVEISRDVNRREYYKALISCRKLFDYEQERLNYVPENVSRRSARS